VIMKKKMVTDKNDRHDVLLYAISTCAWCKLTKQFLKENNVKYDYIDIDLCDEKDKEEIRNHIRKLGGNLEYPAIIIDKKILINGFQKDKLRKALEI